MNFSQDDLLILTADHGNDPTYKGTDHTRVCSFPCIDSREMQAGAARFRKQRRLR